MSIRLILPDGDYDSTVAAAIGTHKLRQLMAREQGPFSKRSAAVVKESRHSAQKNTCVLLLKSFGGSNGSVQVVWLKPANIVFASVFNKPVGTNLKVDGPTFTMDDGLSQRNGKYLATNSIKIKHLKRYPLTMARAMLSTAGSGSFIIERGGQYFRLAPVGADAIYLRKNKDGTESLMQKMYSQKLNTAKTAYEVTVVGIPYAELNKKFDELTLVTTANTLSYKMGAFQITVDLTAAIKNYKDGGQAVQSSDSTAQYTGLKLNLQTLNNGAVETTLYIYSGYYTLDQPAGNESAIRQGTSRIVTDSDVVFDFTEAAQNYISGSSSSTSNYTNNYVETPPGSLELIGSSFGSASSQFTSGTTTPNPSRGINGVYYAVTEKIPSAQSSTSSSTSSGRRSNGFARPIDSTNNSTTRRFGGNTKRIEHRLSLYGDDVTLPTYTYSGASFTDGSASENTGIPRSDGVGFSGGTSTSSNTPGSANGNVTERTILDDGVSVTTGGTLALTFNSRVYIPPVFTASGNYNVSDTFGLAIRADGKQLLVNGKTVSRVSADYYSQNYDLQSAGNDTATSSSEIGRQEFYGSGSDLNGAASGTSSSSVTYKYVYSDSVTLDPVGITQLTRAYYNDAGEPLIPTGAARLVTIAVPKEVCGGDSTLIYVASIHKLLSSAVRVYADALVSVVGSADTVTRLIKEVNAENDIVNLYKLNFTNIKPSLNRLLGLLSGEGPGSAAAIEAAQAFMDACIIEEYAVTKPKGLSTYELLSKLTAESTHLYAVDV